MPLFWTSTIFATLGSIFVITSYHYASIILSRCYSWGFTITKLCDFLLWLYLRNVPFTVISTWKHYECSFLILMLIIDYNLWQCLLWTEPLLLKYRSCNSDRTCMQLFIIHYLVNPTSLCHNMLTVIHWITPLVFTVPTI